MKECGVDILFEHTSTCTYLLIFGQLLSRAAPQFGIALWCRCNNIYGESIETLQTTIGVLKQSYPVTLKQGLPVILKQSLPVTGVLRKT